jgi:hypothetical protein
MREWLAIALQRNVISRGVKVGAVVGTVLVAIREIKFWPVTYYLKHFENYCSRTSCLFAFQPTLALVRHCRTEKKLRC